MRAAWLCFVLAVNVARAQDPCVACHPREVEAYGRSTMAASLGRPLGHPGGTFTHSASRTRFTISSNEAGMRHRYERAERIAEYPIEFFIGSGHQGRSYLTRIGQYLVQSPASYYSRRRAWDLSPGYASDPLPAFDRRITEECLFCHASGTSADPQPIGCERCHGPTTEHITRPSAANVVTPRRLTARMRDGVCEQCHLGGEARIPNPGRKLREFVAGRALEEVLTVYIAEPPGAFRVTSHAEQLAASACAAGAGERLWCGTCHNPHDPPSDRAAYYRARCAGCHVTLAEAHPKPAGDCAGCHMPKRAAADVPHMAYTDHRIQRRPAPFRAPSGAARLRAWREPASVSAGRNLGLAYISVGERDDSRFHLDEGFRLLSNVETPDPEVHTALGLVWMKRNAPATAARHFERALESRPDDPARLVNLGAALRTAGDVVRAAVYLRRALELDPLLAEARELLQGIQERDLATALYRERRFAEAAAALEKHLARQPDDHNARLLLGLSLQQAGTLARAAEVLHEATRRRPRDASAHYYLARVEYLRGLLEAGEQSARRALELGESPARVYNLLGLIRVEQGRNAEALALYADASRANPGFPDSNIHAGVLLIKLGRFKEALDRLDTAVRLDPASAEARYHRARTLIELGRNDVALSDLEAAASNHDQARRLLQQFRAGGLASRPSGGAGAVAPIRFRNAAETAGLRFTVENHVTPQKHVVETMAGGVAAFDFNNDGRIDIFFTNGAHLPSLKKTSSRYWNRLFRNDGNMKFTDVTEQAGVAGYGYSIGVAAADFNNDGYVDLFVSGVNQNTLYRNRGDGTFEDVTAKAGLRSGLWSVAGGWFDYDRDGFLDLFVVNYLKWSPFAEPECLAVSGKLRVYCHPDRYQGLPNTLYRNRGDGTFEDVSAASGIAAHVGKGMSVAFADYDLDGFTDVFVANDTLPNFLFRNRGDGTFEEVGLQAGAGVNDDGRAVSSMGADFRDYDGDGLPDIVVTALKGETFPLFRNQGKGFFRDVTYPSRLGLLSFARSGWSVALVDFNNDGYRDLFAANSHVSDHVDTYRQPNSVFAGAGGGTFVDASESLAASPAVHRGAAFADFNNDGRIDVIVTSLGGQAELWENVSPEPHRWLRLRLEGMRSNRDGIGARVRVGHQHDHATTSLGYASSSAGGLHFALGRLETVGEIEILWPRGAVQVLRNVRTNQILTVKENGVGTADARR